MVYASRHRKCVYLQNLGCSHSNQKLSQRKYTTCNTFTYQFIEGAFHLMKFPSIFRHEQGYTCSWGYDLSLRATQMTKLYNPDTVYRQESALYCVLSSLTQFYDGVNSGLTSSQLIL